VSWFTHLQLAQLFISLLVSTLSQKEHWIGIISDARRGGVVAVSERGGHLKLHLFFVLRPKRVCPTDPDVDGNRKEQSSL